MLRWGAGGDGAISLEVYAARQLVPGPVAWLFVADEFDPDAMVQRFKERAQVDFMDFAMIGDAKATIEDGILTLRVDLRPAEGREEA